MQDGSPSSKHSGHKPAILIRPIAPNVLAAIKDSEEAKWSSEESVQEAYVDESLRGSVFAPRETNRIRSDLSSLLELIRQQRQHDEKKQQQQNQQDEAEGKHDEVSVDASTKKQFEAKLAALATDLSLIIDASARALKKQASVPIVHRD